MNAHAFADARAAARFIRGGRAILTIASRKSGEHRTFRVSQREGEDGKPSPFFVSLLTGPQNTADYTYAGILAADGSLRLTKKSRLTTDAIPVRAWNYVARHLAEGKLPPDAEVMHEGKCAICARPLTTPESLARGIGPECWAKGGFEAMEKPEAEPEAIAEPVRARHPAAARPSLVDLAREIERSAAP